MIDFVYDFGSLSSHTESLYIKAMLRSKLAKFNTGEVAAVQPAARGAGRGAQSTRPGRGRDGADDFEQLYYAPLSPFDEFVDVFADLICSAQEHIRDLNGGERSSASLRFVFMPLCDHKNIEFPSPSISPPLQGCCEMCAGVYLVCTSFCIFHRKQRRMVNSGLFQRAASKSKVCAESCGVVPCVLLSRPTSS